MKDSSNQLTIIEPCRVWYEEWCRSRRSSPARPPTLGFYVFPLIAFYSVVLCGELIPSSICLKEQYSAPLPLRKSPAELKRRFTVMTDARKHGTQSNQQYLLCTLRPVSIPWCSTATSRAVTNVSKTIHLQRRRKQLWGRNTMKVITYQQMRIKVWTRHRVRPLCRQLSLWVIPCRWWGTVVAYLWMWRSWFKRW